MRSIPVRRHALVALLASLCAGLGVACAGAGDPAPTFSAAASDGAHAGAPAEAPEAGASADPEREAATPRTAGDQAATPAEVSARAPTAGAGEPGVALARFTTAVEDREPIDAVSFLPNEQREVLFYTDLRGLEGSTVVHRWEYEGEVMAEVPFAVRSPRWRVWSSKALRPEWIGDWTASVVGPDGEILAIETFTYQKAD